jgi:dolichyl-diphosphooligosaccharide--protein glycosyltransferase
MNEIPSMTDAWYQSLSEIKQESEEDAVINSWWDFGHWFKAIGDRAVTFDGASQNTPMAHWIGKSLLTEDEKLSVGILRMLDCSSNDAFEYVHENVTEMDMDESIGLLYTIVRLDRDEAGDVLEDDYSLTTSKKDKILELTHCDAPENYYITSGDMVGKSGVWAHFGSWDFDRAQMWINVKGKSLAKGTQYLMDNFGYDEDDAESLYYDIQELDTGRSSNDWIAPWPSYMSAVAPCNPIGETLQCGNGLIINLTNMNGLVGTQQGIMSVERLGLINAKGNFEIMEFNETNTIPLGAVLLPDGNSFSSILMHPDLVGSMFTRLFYLGGHELKHFEMFSDKQSVIGQRILVWKVDWEGQVENNVFVVQEPVIEEPEEVIELLDDIETDELDGDENELDENENEPDEINQTSTTDNGTENIVDVDLDLSITPNTTTDENANETDQSV